MSSSSVARHLTRYMARIVRLGVAAPFDLSGGAAVPFDLSAAPFDVAVSAAAASLAAGGIVAVPSDTLYGVVARLEFADRLYELKKRSCLKPLGLFLADAQDAHEWAHVTVSDSLLARLLPGPVTLIFERAPALPAAFNPDTDKIGIRVPDCAFVRALSRAAAAPLAQTSANTSGATLNPTRVEHFKDIHEGIDLIIDAGPIEVYGGVAAQGKGGGDSRGEGSTIVDLSKVGFYRILRDGCALKSTVAKLVEAGLRCEEQEL